VSKPLSYGVQRLGRAFDFANSMRQYMKKRPGMNLTYVLDGVMKWLPKCRYNANEFYA